jgi:uncharacterized membrane protein YgcG
VDEADEQILAVVEPRNLVAFVGVLTDGQSGSILRVARPDFKEGKYGAGLIKIVDGIAGLADPPEARTPFCFRFEEYGEGHCPRNAVA